MLTYADAPADLVRTAVSGNLLFDASKSKAELGKIKKFKKKRLKKIRDEILRTLFIAGRQALQR